MSDFVTPETRTLPLSGEGRSITIRRRLNYGEKTAMYARMSTTGDDGRRKVDGIKMEIGIISAYLLDWTLRGDDGAVVEIRGLSPDDLGDVINSLEPEAVDELRDAIDAHVDREERARAEEKKVPAPASV
jgi:hypothetical protein